MSNGRQFSCGCCLLMKLWWQKNSKPSKRKCWKKNCRLQFYKRSDERNCCCDSSFMKKFCLLRKQNLLKNLRGNIEYRFKFDSAQSLCTDWRLKAGYTKHNV